MEPFIVIGIILIIVGFIGCFIPGLPGPPLSYAGLLLAHFADSTPRIMTWALIVFGFFTAITLIVDYLLPLWGTKKLGGSKYGIYGAIIGLILGLFMAGFGAIPGAFAGAIIGEMYAGKEPLQAAKSGIGIFLGVLMSSAMKFTLSLIITIVFMANAFNWDIPFF